MVQTNLKHQETPKNTLFIYSPLLQSKTNRTPCTWYLLQRKYPPLLLRQLLLALLSSSFSPRHTECQSRSQEGKWRVSNVYRIVLEDIDSDWIGIMCHCLCDVFNFNSYELGHHWPLWLTSPKCSQQSAWGYYCGFAAAELCKALHVTSLYLLHCREEGCMTPSTGLLWQQHVW